MKKKLTITVDGKEYPCRPTMGAMLRFKQETGREVTQIEPGDLSGLVTYLWCCIRSSCKREGTDFPLSLMDFAEFAAACKAYAEEREQGERRSWERMRLLAAVCIQPHVRKRISPQQLIPLPWDKPARKEKTEIPSAEQALRRLKEITKKKF